MSLRVQELMAVGEGSESGVPADQPDFEPTQEAAEEAPDDGPKKKKKKKKDKVKEEEREEEITPSHQHDGNMTVVLNGSMHEANGNEVCETKKKKKKKEKHVKEEEEEVDLSRREFHGSDSSGYLSDKPTKKRKHETGTDVTSGSNEHPKSPKSKKKRKNDTQT